VTTEHVTVWEATRRLGVKDDAAWERARRGSPDVRAYAHSGAAEEGKGKARQRSVRWMELGWEGTTAAREEARKEAVLEMLRSVVEDSQRGRAGTGFLARWESPW
jgi:hypothetical protein